jgi:hypothetical protein
MYEGTYFFVEKNNLLYLKRDENDGRPCISIDDIDKFFPYGSEIIYLNSQRPSRSQKRNTCIP